MSAKLYTLAVCDACRAGKGDTCHEPTCAFCRVSMDDTLREALHAARDLLTPAATGAEAWSEAGLVTHRFKSHYDVSGDFGVLVSSIAQRGDYIRVYEPRFARAPADQPAVCACGHNVELHINGRPQGACLEWECACERFEAKEVTR